MTSTLLLRTNASGFAEFAIALSGEGASSVLEVLAPSLSFGNVVVGTTKTVPFTAINRGGTPLDVSFGAQTNVVLCTGASPPTDFCLRVVSPAPAGNGFTLEGGQVAMLEVDFAPSVAGTRADGNVILQTCPRASCEVPIFLSGVGVESGIVCSPSSVDFGTVAVGATATALPTCTNRANDPVTVVVAELVIGSEVAFSVDPLPSPPPVLNEDETLMIPVRFSPERPGPATGTLRINVRATRSGSVTMPLSGEGIP